LNVWRSYSCFRRTRIQLRRGNRKKLERLERSRVRPQRLVQRARIVLRAADGKSIAQEVGVSRPTVTVCLDRYEAEGMKGIKSDRPRSGRSRRITAELEV
jgi:hypothetical protein